MTETGYGRRKLPYPYSYITELIQPVTIDDVPGDATVLDPVCNAFTVALTPDQSRQFTSALQAGFDLLYPDVWQDLMQLWDNARQHPNDPFWIETECSHVDFCALVAECIETDPGVREKIIEIIREIGIGGQDGDAAVPGDDDLDCIYGATESSYELLLDWWLNVKVAVDAATQLTDVLSELLPPGSWLAIGVVNGIEALLTAGTSAYEAWINSQAVENAFRCGIFDAICGRGAPYLLYDSDIDAGFDAIAAASPPVPLVTEVIRTVSTYGALKQLWTLRTDDTCSNDWLTLCGCNPNDIEITFDEVTTAAYSLSYTIFPGFTEAEAGDLQSTEQGNPVPSFQLPFIVQGTNKGRNAFLRIDLVTPTTLSDVQYEYWYKQPLSNVLNRSIKLYDASDNLLDSADDTAGGTQEAWNTYAPGVSGTDVAYIIINPGVLSTSGFNPTNVDVHVDNVKLFV